MFGMAFKGWPEHHRPGAPKLLDIQTQQGVGTGVGCKGSDAWPSEMGKLQLNPGDGTLFSRVYLGAWRGLLQET